MSQIASGYYNHSEVESLDEELANGIPSTPSLYDSSSYLDRIPEEGDDGLDHVSRQLSKSHLK